MRLAVWSKSTSQTFLAPRSIRMDASELANPYGLPLRHDGLGNLTSVLQNGSRARSFSYDSLSRLLTSTNPEVGTITYTYDANSNVLTKKDARNITTTYAYDALNREKSTTYSNGDQRSPRITTNELPGSFPCQNIASAPA